MHRSVSFVYFLLLFSFSLSAQETYNLVGTIGSYPVYLKLNCYDDTSCIVTYFYKKTLQDIPLRGKPKGDSFRLYTLEMEYDADAKGEVFHLVKQRDGAFTGTWTYGDKILPVTLNPLKPETASSPFHDFHDIEVLKYKDPYEYVRASFLVFQKDSVTSYNGKQLIWYEEKYSKTVFFRIGKNFTTEQQDLINPVLTQMHLNQAMSRLSCSSPFGGGEISFEVSINYLDQNLLGCYIFSSWDCGGAHPDFGGSGYLIDLHNGRQYELDDIIAFDSSVTTEAKSGFDKYSDYRSRFLAPKLMNLIRQVYHLKPPRAEDDDYCNYLDTEIWDFPSWSFTEKGIVFTPYFARVARSCEQGFLLPFSILSAYKNPAFPYPFPK